MVKYNSWKIIFLFYCLISVIGFSSCKKDGELLRPIEVFNFSITSFSVNSSSVVSVFVNGEVVHDSLDIGQPRSRIVPKMAGGQHVIIKDYLTGSVIVDTIIDVAGKTTSLTLLQVDTSVSPVLVGEPQEGIPENHRQQSLFYTDSRLPDSVAVRVYGCHYDPNTFELMKTDTLAIFQKIRRGELSVARFIPDVADPSTTIYFFEVLDPVTMISLPNVATPFDPAIFSGIAFSFSPGGTGTETRYIDRLHVTGTSEFFDVYTERLVSY